VGHAKKARAARHVRKWTLLERRSGTDTTGRRDPAPPTRSPPREAGLRIVALTNSGAQAGRTTLEGCGLLALIERVLGVDAVSTFKPGPDVYAYALSEVQEDPHRVALLATHPWDLAGAAHDGMRTAWMRHRPRAWPSVFPNPDAQADTLTDLATAILAHR
jgi:2-haloacid dehalogenase